MNGHADVTIGHLSEARKFWGHGLSHAQDLPCELCTKLSQLVADLERDARLKEAEDWNAMLKVQDLRVCDIQWAKERIEQLKRGEL